MGGNNRQRKSSSFMSVFNVFKSNPRHRGGGHHDAYEEGIKPRKVWPSDDDRGQWGAADPDINKRAEDFIAQYKKKVSESEIHFQAQTRQ